MKPPPVIFDGMPDPAFSNRDAEPYGRTLF